MYITFNITIDDNDPMRTPVSCHSYQLSEVQLLWCIIPTPFISTSLIQRYLFFAIKILNTTNSMIEATPGHSHCLQLWCKFRFHLQIGRLLYRSKTSANDRYLYSHCSLACHACLHIGSFVSCWYIVALKWSWTVDCQLSLYKNLQQITGQGKPAHKS